MSNQDVSVAELARVVELDASEYRHVPNSEKVRLFRATLASGSDSEVVADEDETLGGFAVFCREHQLVNGCECACRVLCLLHYERYKKLEMSLVGFAINGGMTQPVTVNDSEKPPLALVEA